MDTQTALRHAAKLEYTLIRLPLNLVDEKLVQRYLDDDSPVRQSFERALGALDEAVGKLLREPGTHEGRHDDEPEATPPNATARPRAAKPRTAKPKAAEPKAPADAPTPKVVEDETEQIEHLTEELLDEEKTETFVGELAEDDELRKVQAELQAKRLIEEQQEGR